METYRSIDATRDVDARTTVRVAVKEIIASIKQIERGAEAVPDDVQLFSDGLGEPTPLDMDSLDALDLALALKERFDPDGERFEAFLNGEVDLQELGTVNKITDFVLSLAKESTNGHAVSQAGVA
jgi:acyl carrier protein